MAEEVILQELRDEPTWADVGLRSVSGNPGVRKEMDHWRYFDDDGDYPGLFTDADAARWGCWLTEARAAEINATRLITIEDTREGMIVAMDSMAALRRTP